MVTAKSLPRRIDRNTFDAWIVQSCTETPYARRTSTTGVRVFSWQMRQSFPWAGTLRFLYALIDMRPALADGTSRRARRASRIRASGRRVSARTVASRVGPAPGCDGWQHGSAAGNRPIARLRPPSRSPPATSAGTSVTAVPDSPDRLSAALETTATLRSARPCTRPASSALGPTSYPLGSRRPVRAPSRRSPSGQGAHLLSRFNRWRSHGRVERYAARRCDLPRPRRHHAPRAAVLEAMLPFFTERFGNASEPHWAGRAARAGLVRRAGARRRRARRRPARGRLHGRRLRGRQHRDPRPHARAARAHRRERHRASRGPRARACARRARLGRGRGRRSTRTGVLDLDAFADARPPRRHAGLRDVGQQRDGRRPARRGGRRDLRRARRAAAPRRRAGALRRPRRASAPCRATSPSPSPRTSSAARRASASLAGRGIASLQATVLGGGQERGLRPGTENVARRVGLATALELRQGNSAEWADAGRPPRPHEAALGLPVAGGGAPRLPGHALLLTGARGDMLVHLLDGHDIAVAAGSACSSGDTAPSHVLVAMGIEADVARGALRVSLGPETTAGEVDTFVAALARGAAGGRAHARRRVVIDLARAGAVERPDGEGVAGGRRAAIASASPSRSSGGRLARVRFGADACPVGDGRRGLAGGRGRGRVAARGGAAGHRRGASRPWGSTRPRDRTSRSRSTPSPQRSATPSRAARAWRLHPGARRGHERRRRLRASCSRRPPRRPRRSASRCGSGSTRRRPTPSGPAALRRPSAAPATPATPAASRTSRSTCARRSATRSSTRSSRATPPARRRTRACAATATSASTPCSTRPRRLGGERLLTGHYARIVERRRRAASWPAAPTPRKDQSYMLARLARRALARVGFPLGASTKDETRARARALGLAAADAPESQEVCFLGGGDYRGFLRRAGVPFGDGAVVDEAGRELGRHDGAAGYTAGPAARRRRVRRRAALRAAHRRAGERRRGRAARAPRHATGCASTTCNCTFRGRAWTPSCATARPPCRRASRTRRTASSCTSSARPFGVAPGQTAALYDGDAVVGAGTIALDGAA